MKVSLSVLLLFSFSNVLFIFLDVHHPKNNNRFSPISVHLEVQCLEGKSKANHWSWIGLFSEFFSKHPFPHRLLFLNFISSILQFFKNFPSFSLSPSSFTRSISLPFSTIFQFYFYHRLTLWFLNYASRRFKWFFSPESFSIFFACFHPIRRPYQPPTFSSFFQYFFIMIWVFRLHLFNFSLHLSIIFHNIQIFLFRHPFNTFLFSPTNFLTNFSVSFLSIFIQMQIKFFFFSQNISSSNFFPFNLFHL